MPFEIEIGTRTRKFAITAVVLLFTIFYAHLVARHYRALRWAASTQLPNIEKAVELEPGNADFHHLLGRFYFFVEQNPAAAIEQYQIALRLQPRAARFWLDLATAHQVTGDAGGYRQALEHAVEADRKTTDVAREAANFYLSAGELDRAFEHYRTVIENDPGDSESSLNLCWRASHDAPLILNKVVPARIEPHLALLRILLRERETAAAGTVWRHLIALRQSLQPMHAFPYIQFLIDQQDMDGAYAAWMNFLSVSPAMSAYSVSGDNLIVNAGFEEDFLSGGFDWRFTTMPPAFTIAPDSRIFHSGTRSLRLDFDGQPGENAGVLQYVPVRPSTSYVFSGFVKTEDLEGASGPRFAIYDPVNHQQLALGEDWLGSAVWREQRLEFTTSPKTITILVLIMRSPWNKRIKGEAWMDDIRLSQR